MYSKRKPYLGLKQSIREFFTARVRHLKETNVVESQFEKPYLEDEYPSMHLAIPAPSWPSWNFGIDPLPRPKWNRGIGGGGGGGFPPSKAPECPCCYFLYWGDCEDGGYVRGQWWAVFHPEYPWKAFTHKWEYEGAFKNVEESGPTPAIPSHDIWLEWDESQAQKSTGYVWGKLCYIIKGVCKQCYDLWATCVVCVCPPDVAFAWDDDTSADTVVRSGNCTVAVNAGGGGPYTWAVSGTDFSIPATTTGVTNTLSAGGSACGPATIIVTDCCGTDVTGYVRCTTGIWGDPICIENSEQDPGGCTPCCSSLYHGCTITGSYDYYSLVVGYERWLLYNGSRECVTSDGSCDYLWDPDGACFLAHPPPCGSPTECGQAYAPWDCSSCNPSGTPPLHYAYYNKYNYYNWQCA